MEDNRFASVGAIVFRDNDVLLVRHIVDSIESGLSSLLEKSGFYWISAPSTRVFLRERKYECAGQIQPVLGWIDYTYGRAAGKLLNPSGFIKQGELPYEALKREVMEETGVEINPQGLLAVGCGVKGWWLVFLARYISGEPRSDKNENSEAMFISSEQAMVHPDVTGATKILIKLATEKRGLLPNTEYSEWIKRIIDDGQILFS